VSSASQHTEVSKSSASDDQKSLAMLYDEHAAVVLGFLEKLSDDKDKAEELLQAVFLALPSRLHEFDAQKGRFVVWLLKLARTIAGQTQKSTDFKTNGNYASTNTPIREQASNVGSSNINPSRRLTAGAETSVVELLYVKGYTFAQAAAELGVEERAVQLMVRTELKKYRR
jgi:RNA polymerase sigma factor (sigma-70 family)